jgi:hypothetical protein
MNISDYIEKKESINSKMISLNLELKELNKLYIESNKEFSVGEKVILGKDTKHQRFAYINNVFIFANKIDYSFLKEKKDGGISKIADCMRFNETISKLN